MAEAVRKSLVVPNASPNQSKKVIPNSPVKNQKQHEELVEDKKYDYMQFYDPLNGDKYFSGLTVRVKKDATLTKIIQEKYGSGVSGAEIGAKIKQIKTFNKIENPDHLKIGQELILPDSNFQLGKNYINKCRAKGIDYNVETVFHERQFGVNRELNHDEYPAIRATSDGVILKNPRAFEGKYDDLTVFEAGSEKRKQLFKNRLYDLFGGTGVGDLCGYGKGAISSLPIRKATPYTTKSGMIKYKVPQGVLNKNSPLKKPKPAVYTRKEFNRRTCRVSFKSNLAINAVASIIDMIFEGCDTGDWKKAALSATKSLIEGVIATYIAASFTLHVLEGLGGPPGWVVFLVHSIIDLGAMALMNYADKIICRWIETGQPDWSFF